MPADPDALAELEIRVGTVQSAEPAAGLRIPAYALSLDFGPAGTRRSLAQLRGNYAPADLLGRQVLAALNLAPKRIGGYVSECLVLGVPDSAGEVALVAPDRSVPAGGQLY